ncbi:MAG: formylglycine-generating enzyme family protein [Cyanobacteriota bacterium]|nr:formylglycine-generating enzyme family protein [Cyanobacteriota bacterium]
MTEKQNQPREYDAALGGKNPPPVNAAVLGGIESVKRRLAATDELVRAGAVGDAMKYGEAGLDLAIASLKDKSPLVRRAVLNLLQEKLSHPKVKTLLANNQSIYEFETLTVNDGGEIIKIEPRLAEMFVEDLGDGVELEMVSIPGGSFLMGSPEGEGCDEERPQHRVNVPSFFMGKYPVTQKQYEAVMGENPAYFKGANRPVEWVGWEYATDFCWLLSQKTGKNYRLPSEAQWEYACRAGTTTPFYFGETITPDLANYDGNYIGPTTDVGCFPPNGFGLYDLYGNVWEWCQDVWHENYNGAPTDGSARESGEDMFRRVKRGGSWSDPASQSRSAYRYGEAAMGAYNDWGFRVVLVI